MRPLARVCIKSTRPVCRPLLGDQCFASDFCPLTLAVPYCWSNKTPMWLVDMAEKNQVCRCCEVHIVPVLRGSCQTAEFNGSIMFDLNKSARVTGAQPPSEDRV